MGKPQPLSFEKRFAHIGRGRADLEDGTTESYTGIAYRTIQKRAFRT
jgi:hypothetical protein